MKESESLYTLWCTGRVGCEGLLVEIKVSLSTTLLIWPHLGHEIVIILKGWPY